MTRSLVGAKGAVIPLILDCKYLIVEPTIIVNALNQLFKPSSCG